MSDIRFACPYCSQHLECDDAWCSNVIACPSCAQQIQVPHFLVFAQGPKTQPPKALPTSMPPPVPPQGAYTDLYARASGLYTQADWDRHLAETSARWPNQAQGPTPLSQMLLFWLLVIGPFPLAIWLGTTMKAPGGAVACLIVFAAVSGFLLARQAKQTGWKAGAYGAMYSVVVFAAYAVLGLGVLFAGCMVACSQID